MIVQGEKLTEQQYYDLAAYVTDNIRVIDKTEMMETQPPFSDSFFNWSMSLAMAWRKGSYFCINKQDEVVCIGGIHTTHAGVGSAWLWATEGFYDCVIELHRFIKSNIARYLREEGHRVQCLTAQMHPNGKEWLEALGFELEGTLKQFGSNREDFLQYAIVGGS